MTSSTPLPVYLHLASTTETSELSTVEHVKDIPGTPRDALILHRLAAYSAAIGGLAEDGGLAVFAASQHVQRLVSSTDQLTGTTLSTENVTLLFDTINTAAAEVLSAAASCPARLLLIHILTLSDTDTNLYLYIVPMPRIDPSEPVMVCTQVYPGRSMPEAKVTSWADTRAPLDEARREVEASELIMIDWDDNILEGLVSNVFVVIEGRVFSAPSTRVLAGHVGQAAIDACEAMDVEVVRECPKVDHLYAASEVFLTSCTRLVQRVGSIRMHWGEVIQLPKETPVSDKVRQVVVKQVDAAVGTSFNQS